MNIFGHVPVDEVRVGDVLAFHAKDREETKAQASRHSRVTRIRRSGRTVLFELNKGQRVFTSGDSVPIYKRD